MVASAKGFPNGTETRRGQVSGEIHGDLAGKCDVFGSPLAGHVSQADVIMVRYFFLDRLDGNGLLALFLQDFAKQVFDDIEGQQFAGQLRVGGDTNVGPFESPNIGADPFCEKIEDCRRKGRTERFFLFLEDGEPGFNVRWAEVGGLPPFEARDESLFESGYFAGRAVAGHDDLLPGFVEGIEGMKELLLDTLFAGQKLNVINQQGLHPAVFIPEFGQLVFLKGCDELIGEALAGHVGDSPAGLLCCIDFMSDGMENRIQFPLEESRPLRPQALGPP